MNGRSDTKNQTVCMKKPGTNHVQKCQGVQESIDLESGHCKPSVLTPAYSDLQEITVAYSRNIIWIL